MKAALIGTVLLSLAGCIGEMGDGWDVERLYQGKKKTLDQVARIHTTEQVYIRQVDERRFKSTRSLRAMAVEVEPGRHRIVVNPIIYTDTGQGQYVTADVKSEVEFECQLEAGHS